MANKRLTKQEARATIAAVRKAGGNQTVAAEKLGIRRSTLAARLAIARGMGMAVPEPAMSGRAVIDRSQRVEKAIALQVEQSKVARLEKKIEEMRAAAQKVKPTKPTANRSGKDDILRVIFPDLHGCMQDTNAVGVFLSDLKRLDPDEVIGLGDLIDAGGFLAQHHVLGYVAQAAYTYEDDIRAAGLFLDAVQEAAPRASVGLIAGNHDGRPEKWCITQALRNGIDAEFLLRHNAPSTLLRLHDRGISYYKRSEFYDGLSVHGTIRRGKCLFTHEAKQSIIHRYGTNVVHGHDHKITSRLIHSVGGGTIGIWSLGCLSQRQPLWMHSTPTEWTHGYAVQVQARSGRFLHLTVPIIDGQSLLPSMKLG